MSFDGRLVIESEQEASSERKKEKGEGGNTKNGRRKGCKGNVGEFINLITSE